MKKRNTLALIGLLVVLAVGTTFAYWNQTATIDNPFDTNKYGSTIVEDFKPSDGEDWQPGMEVNKDVFVKNEGTTDLIVRAKLDETWTRKSDNDPYKTNSAKDNSVYNLDQKDPTDGLTALDQTVVNKTFKGSANWIKGSDGWYYYKENLAGGATTDQWLDAVELKDDADMGKMVTTLYVTTDKDVTDNTTWYTYTGKMPSYINGNGEGCEENASGAKPVTHNKSVTTYEGDKYGYSNSDYVLTVTVQTVQATQEAVNFMFAGSKDTTFNAPTGCAWILR